MMKNLLYIDKEFRDAIGGDKNRSRYIYQILQEQGNVQTCIINDAGWSMEHESPLVLTSTPTKHLLLPGAILDFSQAELQRFVDFIQANQIDLLFFRTIAFSQLALYAKEKLPHLKIIIDVDLILSRLMQQAWQKQRSFKSRYYLIQNLKLEAYESRLYKKDFTFLLSNEAEVKQLKEKYPSSRIEYLPNTTDLVPKQPEASENGVILFYGAMDSTANVEGYRHIHDILYPMIKNKLEKYDYEIRIVGKGCESLPSSRHERIKIVGKVDSIESTILESTFVLLPIYIASGTNTRVIETAMAGRAIITTLLGMEGLASQDFITSYVAKNPSDMARKIIMLMESANCRLEVAQSLQAEIVNRFSFEHFRSVLSGFVDSATLPRRSLLHVPRRFTQKSWGGTETVVMNSAKNLLPLGYNSTIYTSKALDSKSKDHIEDITIRRFGYFYPFFGLSKVQKQGFDTIGGNLFSFSLLYALWRNTKVDLIHLHTLKRMGAIVRTIARWKKIPYVVTLHGGYFNIDAGETSHRQEQLKNGYEWGKVLGWLFGSRKVLDEASAIITLSEEEYHKAQQKHGDRVHYLANGVDVEKFSSGREEAFKKAYGIAQTDKIILCSGRIDTQKNQVLLLEAFKKACETHNDLHLVLLGAVSDDNYLKVLHDYIDEHALQGKVTFVHDLTPKDQLLVDAYKSAQMMVLPSRHEPFGMVILEAWSAGIPVVASATGGITKIISHGKDGLLFKNGDVAELHDNMMQLLEDKELHQTLINNATLSVKKYDWKNIAIDLNAVYESVLKSA